ncbi:hypothetical protein [Ferrovibrio sp.]|uniref:hypothetical protein n=1 Tax=Ferrovibrio sp. TaxID=1917215 RepID=UPI0025C5E075|nr:hypothetical protein [Ferrovibrio sp.]MBX3454441.1 hypothetical protein [Ferrovibrio sp.]
MSTHQQNPKPQSPKPQVPQKQQDQAQHKPQQQGHDRGLGNLYQDPSQKQDKQKAPQTPHPQRG